MPVMAVTSCAPGRHLDACAVHSYGRPSVARCGCACHGRRAFLVGRVGGLLCPSCFTDRAAELGFLLMWEPRVEYRRRAS